uniref:Uncharacterized protein n=1 Tax=Rhizophora mucronata TaxID=61149 RepID=A0A2P2IQ10_RHIMU
MRLRGSKINLMGHTSFKHQQLNNYRRTQIEFHQERCLGPYKNNKIELQPRFLI